MILAVDNQQANATPPCPSAAISNASIKVLAALNANIDRAICQSGQHQDVISVTHNTDVQASSAAGCLPAHVYHFSAASVTQARC